MQGSFHGAPPTRGGGENEYAFCRKLGNAAFPLLGRKAQRFVTVILPSFVFNEHLWMVRYLLG